MRKRSPNSTSADRRATLAFACAISAPKCTASSATPTSAPSQARQFSADHLPEIALSPHDAARCLVRNDVDYLPLDAIAGRIATTPFVVYPPGIATIVPGERLGERAQPMIDYLKMFEASFNAFPGFEVEIQGVYRETDANGRIKLYTYMVTE